MILEEKRKGCLARLRYLKANDYQAIRAFEQGSSVDPVIVEKKQQARSEISLIESATTLAEIENLTVEFE